MMMMVERGPIVDDGDGRSTADSNPIWNSPLCVSSQLIGMCARDEESDDFIVKRAEFFSLGDFRAKRSVPMRIYILVCLCTIWIYGGITNNNTHITSIHTKNHVNRGHKWAQLAGRLPCDNIDVRFHGNWRAHMREYETQSCARMNSLSSLCLWKWYAFWASLLLVSAVGCLSTISIPARFS